MMQEVRQLFAEKNKTQNRKAQLILFLGLLLYALYWSVSRQGEAIVPLILGGLIALLEIQMRVVNYRISKGWFGNNETEAGELLSFINEISKK